MPNLSPAILVLSTVVAFGVALGSLRYRKIGLGSAGVLFIGILDATLALLLTSKSTCICSDDQTYVG